MKFKPLKKLNSRELLDYGAVIFLMGFLLSVFEESGLFVFLSSVLLRLLGSILALKGTIGLKREKEKSGEKVRTEKRKQIRGKTNKILIALLTIATSALAAYWFEYRPQEIRLECIKSTTNITVDFFDESKNDLNKAYEDCIRAHGFEK